MSKRFFINNLDTDFGKALLEELVKQPTQDPIHMGTTKTIIDAKPNGVKKILKRQKPKLYRKKMTDQCDVYVYNLNQTEISDIEFGIQTMLKPIQDNKVFILVSDLMVWSDSGKKVKKEQKKVEEGEEGQAEAQQKKQQQPPKEDGQPQASQHKESQHAVEQQEEEVPIQYTFFEDSDYKDRKPLLRYQYIKQIEDKVLSTQKQNIKVFVVCPGLIYGCGQDNLYPIFKAAWLQNPKNLPYLGQGSNLVPMIHLKDLVKFVVKVAQNPPEGNPYLLAFDMNQNRTQKAIIQSISQGVGSGEIISVEHSDLFENPDLFLIDIDIQPSKLLVGAAEEPVQFEWTSKDGIGKNIQSILGQFCKKHYLRPIKLLFLQNDESWREDSKINYIYQVFSDYYRIPVLTIKDILASAKEKGDKQLKQDLIEEWANISEYLLKNEARRLDETLKVFYRAVRWRLNQNDCTNRGYILQNFPLFKEQLQHIFLKISPKKLKRKRKPQPKQKKVQKVEKQDNQQNDQPKQEGEELQNEDKKQGDQVPLEDQQKQEEPEPEPEPEQEEQEEEGGQGQGQGPKYQLSFPQSIISIKQVGKESPTQVIEFFTTKGIEELIYDTTGAKEREIFQSLRSYIERNGRPNNYLIEEEELLKKHKLFVEKQNEISLKERQKELNLKTKQAKDVTDQRNKLRDDITQIVRTQGEEQIKKMPFRNYLMQFVVPTLNEGLLEVSNIIPNDPVDLLAEYLYQKSYDF